MIDNSYIIFFTIPTLVSTPFSVRGFYIFDVCFSKKIVAGTVFCKKKPHVYARNSAAPHELCGTIPCSTRPTDQAFQTKTLTVPYKLQVTSSRTQISTCICKHNYVRYAFSIPLTVFNIIKVVNVSELLY